MTELFTNIPDEIKKQHETIIDLAFTILNPFQIDSFLQNYINNTQADDEKDFINFLVNLRRVKYQNEHNND